MALKIKNREIRSTNNRLLFIIGLIGVAGSVWQKNSILWIVAWVIALTGLINIPTWADEKGWLNLTTSQRRGRVLSVILITSALLTAAILFSWIGSLS